VCGQSRQPLLDACRQFKALYGVTGELVQVFNKGSTVADISCTVDVGARYTVKERAAGGIRFERFEVMSPAAVSAARAA
jgi:hypothetical protein